MLHDPTDSPASVLSYIFEFMLGVVPSSPFLKKRCGTRRWAVLIYGCLAVLMMSAGTWAQQDTKVSRSNTGTSAEVARGKYLVENVAMCGQCHTPRDASGALDPVRPLDGAPVTLRPPNADPNWPINAPRIGGNPPASDADMVKLLTTGIWTNGKPLRFPMMPFRMSESDARAVVSYLKSLHPQQ